ncbi:uncharacterized protein [Blastocystis hominis]|uniref:Uncharacterized protein n=1 Tax=Blastocystis hominis TaxID=12968 RepID=D8M423_BLAHO|nr:uncharacterized protein [Blastocystis hominis]XP_012899580.1 uncharacterized protein [Blastocystis hominis]CBK22812.2 unnamed protein product [Blastocystis hominis]CBK25532.2 unnamed protein product [Blastocystis hominis]|eukprot:XP_012896860.1 uncharacterized protein [Blastocystis hominis]
MSEASTRIAIVDGEKCKPSRCNLECKRYCPLVKMGKLCVEVKSTSKISFISEELCIGCGICVKKCPYKAISIINLPKSLENETTHRFGPNSFKLHRLPTPRPNQVLGLVGTNGIGKSTALKILAGKLKPNLGSFNNPPDWEDILKYYRGSELQNYLKRILLDDLTAVTKIQYVDIIPKHLRGQVEKLINARDKRGIRDSICSVLELNHLMSRDIDQLSGGELQRFAIAITAMAKSDVYMFDEPSSYLDVKQRLRAAEVIRSVLEAKDGVYVIVVEHDLAVLDYLSDFVCVLYGRPGAYGVVTMPFNVRDGINVFLAGFVPTENLRFRELELTFKVAQTADDVKKGKRDSLYEYEAMTKTLQGKGHKFVLHVEKGNFSESEIIVMLGENGTGKTTFIRMLAGLMKSDEEEAGRAPSIPALSVSYKPQTISPKFQGSVEDLFQTKIRAAYIHPQFQTDVLKPMNLDGIMDQPLSVLSGGELQRVALVLALGKPANIYLIDEPSAYLDSEQRIVCARIIKRFILHAKRTAFIVEHDFIMATYLADRVVVYEGQPGVECTAKSPESLLTGMNRFLKHLSITFRRDPNNYRPRINKMDSQKDKEQKASGNYFFMQD